MTVLGWLRAAIARLVGNRESFILGESDCVILDIDVSGVDVRRDRSTGIAVLPVAGNAFRLADLAYCRLPPTGADGERGPAEWRECYQRLVDFLGDRPVVTFNPNFVRYMLERTLAALDLPLPRGEWIDLGLALQGAFGKEMGQVESLHSWQRRLEVASVHEHAAVADVFAMAQMFEILLVRCEEAGLRTLADLRRAQKSQAWLRGE